MDEYDRLLMELKQGPTPTAAEIALWNLAAVMIVTELKADLEGVALRDDAKVHNLVQAKFNRPSRLPNKAVVVDEDAPVQGSGVVHLAFGAIGRYPDAYNITVSLVKRQISVYLTKMLIM